MRTMLVVAVITGVGCLEPAPQTPAPAAAPAGAPAAGPAAGDDRRPPPPPPPPVGRLVVGDTHGAAHLDVEQTFGPVIASGTVAGRPWSMRGRIDARDAFTWVGTDRGGGGGGGALPFQDLRWKKLGHFGSVGSNESRSIGVPATLSVCGTVSKQTAAIEVRLADGTRLPAQIVDTGDVRASFFVAVWSTPAAHWEVLIARDAAGAELETYRPPQTPAIPPPPPPSTTPTP